MAKFLAWLKKQSDFVTSLGILMGGAAAVIIFFGGSIPPWETPAEAATAVENAARLNAATVQAISRLNDNMNSVSKRLDAGDCGILQTKLEQAKAALERNPNDTSAKMLRDLIQAQMRSIPNCAPF